MSLGTLNSIITIILSYFPFSSSGGSKGASNGKTNGSA
jgi:hypothetical protein